jgi:hypothetical protein
MKISLTYLYLGLRETGLLIFSPSILAAQDVSNHQHDRVYLLVPAILEKEQHIFRKYAKIVENSSCYSSIRRIEGNP